MSKRTRLVPKVIVMARPITPPGFWPTEHGGWVSVDPSGSGWSSGLDEGMAIDPKLVKTGDHMTVGEICEAFLAERNPASFHMQIIQAKAPAQRRSTERRKTKKPAAKRKPRK